MDISFTGFAIGPDHDLILPLGYRHRIRDLATQIRLRPPLQSPARQLRQITAICVKDKHVPAVTIVIDTPERTGTAYSVIDELTAKQGLVTSESVTAIRSASPAARGEED